MEMFLAFWLVGFISTSVMHHQRVLAMWNY
jgi:hypothetical protein